jgi:hypothetical protein
VRGKTWISGTFVKEKLLALSGGKDIPNCKPHHGETIQIIEAEIPSQMILKRKTLSALETTVVIENSGVNSKMTLM